MTLPSSNTPRFRLGTDPQGPASRSRNPLWLATTLSAALLAACGGGGDGAETAGTSVDTGTDMSQFESVISADPKVRQMVVARALSPKAESSDERDRRTSADDDKEGDRDDDESDKVDNDESDKGESDKGDSDKSDESDGDDSDGSRDTGTSGIVETLIGDMREMNDHPLKNVNRKYGWAHGPGYVQGGVNSGGRNYVLPWFVTFEGEGNSARNTRIQKRNLRLFVKTRGGEWKRLVDVDSYGGVECEQHGNYYKCPQAARVRDEEGTASSHPVPGLNLHGWWDSRVRISGHDIEAMVISLEARLIVDDENRGDDRGKAKYLINVGADYYPSDAPPSGKLIPVGVSRAKLVTGEWQTFALTTLSDVGRQEPGGGISEAELRANPPPF